MRDQTIGEWLDALGSSAPTPGGGSAAALLAAIGAGLVEMVANLTIGKARYAAVEPLMVQARDEAVRLRVAALQAAADDERAFDAVAAAYRIPKGDAGRGDAIQTATAAAARPPLRTAELAAAVIVLAERIRDGANVNVLSDVAVAASSARAALESAAINVQVNVAALRDRAVGDALAAELAVHTAAADIATDTIARVRNELAR